MSKQTEPTVDLAPKKREHGFSTLARYGAGASAIVAVTLGVGCSADEVHEPPMPSITAEALPTNGEAEPSPEQFEMTDDALAKFNERMIYNAERNFDNIGEMAGDTQDQYNSFGELTTSIETPLDDGSGNVRSRFAVMNVIESEFGGIELSYQKSTEILTQENVVNRTPGETLDVSYWVFGNSEMELASLGLAGGSPLTQDIAKEIFYDEATEFKRGHNIEYHNSGMAVETLEMVGNNYPVATGGYTNSVKYEKSGFVNWNDSNLEVLGHDGTEVVIGYFEATTPGR